jgi:hypothetical protein
MSLLARFRRKKIDPEIARRALLRQSGRLGDAMVQDASPDASGVINVSYVYDVGGAEYLASQSIDPEQSQRESVCLPGARISIRYDPHRPANSVVV